MKNNLLTQCITKLDRKGLTRFNEFARSPYFNKHKDVAGLVSYFSDIYPNFTEKKCDRQVIYSHLYPTLQHDQKKLAVIFTYTSRLLEQFFRMEQARKDGLLDDPKPLLKFARSNGFSNLLNKIWQEIINGGNLFSGKNIEMPDANDIDFNYFDELDKAAQFAALPNKQYLHLKQSALDGYFITEKLKDACEILQREKLKGEPVLLTPLFITVIEKIEANQLILPPESNQKLFFHAYCMLRQNNISHYYLLKELIRRLASTVETETQQAVYLYLQNFCIGKINLGESNFLNELLDIYKSQLLQGLLTVDGILPEWHYKNIVTTGLRLNEHEWVKSFIEKYKEMLNLEVKENAYSYNLAAYFYHIKRYNEVLNLLLQVEYTDIRYNLDAKSLLLKTYYDLEEENPLLALTDSLRQYLKRNKSLSEFQKKGYYNLLKLARTSFRLKVNKGLISGNKWNSSFDKLKVQLAETDTIFNNSWIEEKVAELELL